MCVPWRRRRQWAPERTRRRLGARSRRGETLCRPSCPSPGTLSPLACPSHRRVYLDYNATTPPAPEVVQAVRDAMSQAWGNPSSSYPAGRDPRCCRVGCLLPGGQGSSWQSCHVASCRDEGEGAYWQCPGERGEDGGRPARGHRLHLGGHGGGSNPYASPARHLLASGDEEGGLKGCCVPYRISFSSLSSCLQANNMVIHTACRHFHDSQATPGDSWGTPHIVTSNVEHDSVRLPLEQLVKEGLAGERQRGRLGAPGCRSGPPQWGLFSAGGEQGHACSVMFLLLVPKGTQFPHGVPLSLSWVHYPFGILRTTMLSACVPAACTVLLPHHLVGCRQP